MRSGAFLDGLSPLCLQYRTNGLKIRAMIHTVYFACQLPRSVADALNAESGRRYTQVLVEQYRICRMQGVWLSPKAQERYNDYLNAERPRLLHAHSIDAAQQGFAKACTTTRAARR